MNTHLDAALDYASQGWAVFPVFEPQLLGDSPADGYICSCPKGANCGSPAKHPRTLKGVKAATSDLKIIEKWWARFPHASIGAAMGAPSGRDCIDLDSDKAVANFTALFSDEFPQTTIQRTGGGGNHVIFQQSPVALKNAVETADLFDVRSTGGYIILAPSLHISGERYAINTEPAGPMPAFLVDRLPKANERKSRKKGKQGKRIIAEGSRNDTLYREACALRRTLHTLEALESALLYENQDCDPPLSDGEVRRIAKAAWEQHRPEPERGRSNVEQIPSPAQAEADTLIITDPQAHRKDAPFHRSDLVPPSSFLNSYIEYVEPTTDAPDQFTMMCGMSILSMACRNSYIRYGQSTLRPNMWLAIVAPSGLYRKSTSIDTARYLLDDWCGEPVTFPDQMSPEAFVKHLATEKSYGLFAWSEIASQLEAFEHRSYMRGYKADLTALFDCPAVWHRRTQSDGMLKVEKPFVNIMAASTIDWLNACLSEGNMRGGFLPRFLWVIASEKRRFLAWPEAPHLDAKEGLLHKLDAVTRMFNGGMSVTDEAKNLFTAFATSLEAEAVMNTEHEGLISAFYARLMPYCLKFATIYQIDVQATTALDTPGREISADAMQYAIRLCDYLKQSIALLLDKVSYNEEMANRNKVIDIIRAKPGVLRSALYRKSRLSKRQLDECVTTLTESALITCRKELSGKKGGRPTECFYPLKDE